jgi:pyruvate dehydrogenase E1 component
MGQPGLTAFEPAFADELALIMEWAFGHMQTTDGGSVYLRLSTRAVPQAGRADDGWRADALKGGYWLQRPRGTDALVTMGAIVPEAIEAWSRLAEDYPGLGLLAITSPDLLHRGWSAAQAARARGEDAADAHVETLLAPLGRAARLVTVLDGSPAALSWLGGVAGARVAALGIDRFGQTGDLPDLYRSYGLDADAIMRAADMLFRR